MTVDEVLLGDVVSFTDGKGKTQQVTVIGVIKGFWWDNKCHGDRIVFLMHQVAPLPPYTSMGYVDPKECTLVSRSVTNAATACTCTIQVLMTGGCKCGHLKPSQP